MEYPLEKDPQLVAQEQFLTELHRRQENIRQGKPPVRSHGISVGRVYHFRPVFQLPPDLQHCGKVLMSIMNHKDAYWFNEPVDWITLHIPNYPKVVTDPMDFGLVKGKLEHNIYESVQEFDNDVRLVWYNGLKFNKPGTLVHQATRALRQMFTESMKWFYKDQKITNKECIEPEVIQKWRGSIKLSVRAPSDNPHKHLEQLQQQQKLQPPQHRYATSSARRFHQPPVSHPSGTSPYGVPQRPPHPHTARRHPYPPRHQMYQQFPPIDPATGDVKELSRNEVSQLRTDIGKVSPEQLAMILGELDKDPAFQQANSGSGELVTIDFATLKPTTLWHLRRLIDLSLDKLRGPPPSSSSSSSRRGGGRGGSHNNIHLHRSQGYHPYGGGYPRDLSRTKEALDSEANKLLYGFDDSIESIDVSARLASSFRDGPSSLSQAPSSSSSSAASSSSVSNNNTSSSSSLPPPLSLTPGHRKLSAAPAPIKIRPHPLNSDSESSSEESDSESESEVDSDSEDDDRHLAHFVPH